VPGPILVTGATGFAGGHLLEHLIGLGRTVAGWSNPGGQQPADIHADVDWRAIDLLDREAVAAALAELQPSAIYHCGGVADVGGSWSRREQALRVNVMGTHHVLEGVRRAGLRCRVLVTGSALVYRRADVPLDENAPIKPGTPYGVSKLAQEMVALREGSFPVILVRPFNHAGPRQSTAYVTSSFARQIAEIEAGKSDPVLRVGNLDPRRDITDVRDTVRAYRLVMEHGQPQRPYNVCRGVAYRIGDVLDILLGLSNLSVRVEPDPARVRPSDNPVVLGDPTRIAREVGWRAEIPIEQTLSDLLQYWRGRTNAADA
jgi:GDP-4-dehydro-6-deoxy-D-mannose reductase